MDVELVEVGGSPSFVEVVGTDIWFFNLASGASRERDELVRFDTRSVATSHRSQLPMDWRSTYLIVDETAFVLVGSSLEGVPQLGASGAVDNEDSPAIVKIDLRTSEPEVQFQLDPEAQQVEFANDGSVWFTTQPKTSLTRLDLTTGERSSARVAGLFYGFVQPIEDEVWWFNPYRIRKLDPKTGDFVETLNYYPEGEEPELGMPYEEVGFVFRDGKYWVSGVTQFEPDLMFEFDLQTMKVSNPQPADQFPSRSVEGEGFRWECCYGDEEPPAQEREWRRFDSASGELLGEYNFGEFEPFAEIEGNLWLRSEDGLGRVSLDNL